MVEDGDGRSFNVLFNTSNYLVDCTCRMFHWVGLLCRHVFFVFKDSRMECISTRDACMLPIYEVDSAWVDASVGVGGANCALMQVWNEF